MYALLCIEQPNPSMSPTTPPPTHHPVPQAAAQLILLHIPGQGGAFESNLFLLGLVTKKHFAIQNTALGPCIKEYFI